MIIKNLKLENFRNFKKGNFDFFNKATVILGPNASGKTNLLEAVCLLATGKSFRARVEEEMIKYDAEIARVSAKVVSSKHQKGNKTNPSAISHDLDAVRLEVFLTRGEIKVGEEKYEKAPRKKLLLNKISRRLIDFAGNLKVVLFGPWDLELVTASPSLRRKFLDTLLSQVDREYRRAILSYEKGLRQRNKLLYQLREESLTFSRTRLLFWDKLLIKNGDFISQKREEFINFANQTGPLNNQYFQLEYDKSPISEARLEQYALEEIAAATTLVGPHRDDFIFKIKNQRSKIKNQERELARFGSRGEQRMSVLWLKLAELIFIEKKSGRNPVLLLDDIFSELDQKHRKIVVDLVKNKKGQVIITVTDPHDVENFGKVEKIKLGG